MARPRTMGDLYNGGKTIGNTSPSQPGLNITAAPAQAVNLFQLNNSSSQPLVTFAGADVRTSSAAAMEVQRLPRAVQGDSYIFIARGTAGNIPFQVDGAFGANRGCKMTVRGPAGSPAFIDIGYLSDTTQDTLGVYVARSTATGNFPAFYLTAGGGTRFAVQQDGNVQGWGAYVDLSSSQTLKDNIADIADAEQKVAGLRPRQFDHQDFGFGYGFIIEELEQDLPECVKPIPGTDPLQKGYQSQQIMAVLAGGVKDLQTKFYDIVARVEALEQAAQQ